MFLIKLSYINRLDGRLPRNKVHEYTMHLTHQEENELVHWITILTDRGYAPRYRTIRELAGLIRNRCDVGINNEDTQLVNYEEFGKDCVPHFMSRHLQLASARRKLIEAARIKDVSAERLTRWFEDLWKIILSHAISIIWMKVICDRRY
jgi:hypothetical protein